MKTIKKIKIKGTLDIHPDGDIYVGDKDGFHYAGSLVDKDLDDSGIVVSVGGKFIRKFIRVLKRIEVK